MTRKFSGINTSGIHVSAWKIVKRMQGMRTLMLICFLTIRIDGICQNLVPNGSFEEYSECIHDYGEIEVAKGWFQQDGSSDYFNRCCKKKNFVGVPFNVSGYQQPYDIGDAYAGLFLFYYDKRYTLNGYYSREYLHTKLLQPLSTNKEYTVSFHYSLADSSVFYTDHFSICFSSERNLQKVKGFENLLYCENRISKKVDKSVAIDTVNWHKVEFEYLARGGESYLIIGFFHDDLSKRAYRKILKRNRLSQGNTRENACYYYIDNVSVVVSDPEIEFSHKINNK